MLRNSVLAFVFVLASYGGALAAENCTAPAAPELPANGAVLSHEQLMAAADMVSAYSKANLAYKTCLDQIIINPETVTRTEWRAALTAYNDAAPVEQAVWSSYEKISDDWVSANQAKTTD